MTNVAFFAGKDGNIIRLDVGAECTAVAAIQLRMRMRILTRPENSLANLNHQTSKKKLRIQRCEGIR